MRASRPWTSGFRPSATGRPRPTIWSARPRPSCSRHSAACLGQGDDTWAEAIGRRLDARGWTLASARSARAASLLALLGDQPWLRFGEILAGPDVAGADAHAGEPTKTGSALAGASATPAAADVGVAVEIRAHGSDTEVLMAVAGARASGAPTAPSRSSAASRDAHEPRSPPPRSCGVPSPGGSTDDRPTDRRRPRRGCAFLAGLGPSTLDRLAAVASVRNLADGDTLYEQGGEPGTCSP